jgi:uncharacterized membrane protein
MHIRQCEVCGKRAARYVCQECGRQVCERCLEPHLWICSECYKRLRPEAPTIKPFAWLMPLKLFFLGFLLTFVGIMFVLIAGFLSGDSVGFIWILPFPPIIVGDGWSYPLWAILFAVAVTALGIILFVLFWKHAQRVESRASGLSC